MKRITFFICSPVVFVLAATTMLPVGGTIGFGSAYAQTTKVILDDATGGDCTSIGRWNPVNKTCKLAADLFETYIQIGSNGIILNGDGHQMTGSGGGNGVLLNGVTGIIVKNLRVTNFGTGIRLVSSDENALLGITASNNGVGIDLFISDGNSLKGNTANSNEGAGIVLGDSDGNTLKGNTISDNASGIILFLGSDGNTLKGNTASNNDFGIGFASSNDNEIRGNTASNNNFHGIFFSYSNENTVTHNTASSNGEDGLILGFAGSSDDNSFKANIFNFNGRFGINIEAGIGDEFNNNTCSGNITGGSDPAGLCSPQS